MTPGGRHYRPGRDRWLVSYADFITLLFAFFVVLYAVEHSDRAKAKDLSDSVRRALEHRPAAPAPAPVQPRPAPPAPPAPPRENLAPAFGQLSAQLRGEVAAGQMRLALESRGIVISLGDKAFFPSGGDSIYPAAYASLDKVAVVIAGLPNPVNLEGHTDSLPIHTARFKSNWQLSAARSIAVLSYFEARHGIPARRFAIAGYADNQPVADNDSADGRARNRRVDIVIRRSADESSPAAEVSTR